MSRDELLERLMGDLESIDFPLNDSCIIEIKGYSKYYYGIFRDNKNSKKILLYPYMDKDCTKLMNYGTILSTLVHEYCHYLQYTDPKWVRYKGVMHDAEFWRMYDKFIKQLIKKRG